MPTLYLIDGYGQFFRNYHAIRTPMTSPVTKEPTNMTFGFIGMLFKLLKAEGPNILKAGKPDFVAVALDVGGDQSTFRSQLYPEYKANRKETPDDLMPQVDRCLALLKEIGVPVVAAPGFEADDVFAALVHRLRTEHPDLKIRMVAKDKDLKQLLDVAAPGAEPNVSLFDVHADLAFDAARLMEETGLRPDQVIDMLSLMGDTVDNVPGVDGVGEKTAAQLLKDYGTLDNLLAHADEIKGKRGEKLREAAPRLPLSKQLVTLRHDIPIDFTLNAAAVKTLKLEKLLPILRELGFNRYQDELKQIIHGADAGAEESSTKPRVDPLKSPDPTHRSKPRSNADFSPFQGGLFDSSEGARPVRQAQSGTYTCIKTKEQLTALIKELRAAPIISIDTETTSLTAIDAKLCGISISIEVGTGSYIPIRSPNASEHLTEKQVLDALRPILEDAAKPKAGHNLKYDILVFRAHGITLRGLTATGPDVGGGIGCDLDDRQLPHRRLPLQPRHGLPRPRTPGPHQHPNLRPHRQRQEPAHLRPGPPRPGHAVRRGEDADVALQLPRAHDAPASRQWASCRCTRKALHLPLVEVLAEPRVERHPRRLRRTRPPPQPPPGRRSRTSSSRSRPSP